MWRLGFVFHEMAFGLLSIFLPLYIISIGGSLIDIGVMSASALFLAIPASFFWGYVCDRTRRYKRYILLSFSSSAVILCLFTLTSNVKLLIALYVFMWIFHVAHDPPKNVLIAELYTREEWEKTFAVYGGLTGLGWLLGVLLGFFMSACGASAVFTLLLCGGLNFLALALSIIFVEDPILIFERGLVAIERTINFAWKGVNVAFRILDGEPLNGKLEKENLNAFCCGLIFFSLATSILFTPLPIFLSSVLLLPQSSIFALYALNSTGSILGYFIARCMSNMSGGKSALSRIAILRSALTFTLVAAAQLALFSVALVGTILIVMGFIYALFIIHTLALSMEIMPKGKAGLFNALVAVGEACGAFIGPFLAEKLGFTYTFLASGIIFFCAYITFKIFN